VILHKKTICGVKAKANFLMNKEAGIHYSYSSLEIITIYEA